MTNRPTRIVTSPEGKEVVFKEYLTAGERNILRSIYLSAMKVRPGSEVSDTEVGGEILIKAERSLLELAVISYDKVTNPVDVMNTLEAGSPEEYDFVVTEANKTKTGGLTKAK